MKLSLIHVIFLSLFSQNVQNKDIYLIPGGDNLAFECKEEGIIVTGGYEVKTKNGSYHPLKDSNIQKGDVIYEAEHQKISCLNDLTTSFEKYLNAGKINLKIKRNQSYLETSLKLILNENKIQTGLYVKERVLGIGTLSFIDPTNQYYGALGHEVFDSDLNRPIDINTGYIYESEVLGIKKNLPVGEKIASTELTHLLGDIKKNTPYGIFGKMDHLPRKYTPIKMARRSEVKLGKANILTVTKGNKIESFDAEIIDLKKQNDIDMKGITFKITSASLLTLGGGIYYGMSGSPLIQDNLLIGAVTHVISSSPEKGYGLYMESMYETMKKVIN